MTNLNVIKYAAIDSAIDFLTGKNNTHRGATTPANTVKTIIGKEGSLYKSYRFSTRIKIQGFVWENYKNWLRMPKIVGEIEMNDGRKFRVGLIKVEKKYRATLHPQNMQAFCVDIF